MRMDAFFHKIDRKGLRTFSFDGRSGKPSTDIFFDLLRREGGQGRCREEIGIYPCGPVTDLPGGDDNIAFGILLAEVLNPLCNSPTSGQVEDFVQSIEHY